MRFYLNVQPATFPIPSGTGDIMAQTLSRNLRNFRIVSAFDFCSFTIKGVSLFRDQTTTLDDLLIRAHAYEDKFASDMLRIVVTEEAFTISNQRDDLDLLIGVRPSETYSWLASTSTEHAWIGYSANDPKQRDAAILDVFQDIMIANCPSIQAVMNKYISAQQPNMRGRSKFYNAKAAFAMTKSSNPNMLLKPFAPDKYVSFSAMARRKFHMHFGLTELEALRDLWIDFLGTLSQHFLTADEAATLVLNGRFRDTLKFERSRRRYVDANKLREILGDPSIVRATGSYILCIKSKNPKPGEMDEASARFGRTSKDRIRTFRLCDQESYKDMERLVRSGVATPIRLFLKRP